MDPAPDGRGTESAGVEGGGGFREGDGQAVVSQVFPGEGTARATPGPAGAAGAFPPLDVRVGAPGRRGYPTPGDRRLPGAGLVRPRAAGPALGRAALTPALGTSPPARRPGPLQEPVRSHPPALTQADGLNWGPL